jgi:hypothetical protein
MTGTEQPQALTPWHPRNSLAAKPAPNSGNLGRRPPEGGAAALCIEAITHPSLQMPWFVSYSRIVGLAAPSEQRVIMTEPGYELLDALYAAITKFVALPDEHFDAARFC